MACPPRRGNGSQVPDEAVSAGGGGPRPKTFGYGTRMSTRRPTLGTPLLSTTYSM